MFLFPLSAHDGRVVQSTFCEPGALCSDYCPTSGILHVKFLISSVLNSRANLTFSVIHTGRRITQTALAIGQCLLCVLQVFTTNRAPFHCGPDSVLSTSSCTCFSCMSLLAEQKKLISVIIGGEKNGINPA